MVQLAGIPFLKSGLRLASISSDLQPQTVSGVMRICELQKRANLILRSEPALEKVPGGIPNVHLFGVEQGWCQPYGCRRNTEFPGHPDCWEGTLGGLELEQHLIFPHLRVRQ